MRGGKEAKQVTGIRVSEKGTTENGHDCFSLRFVNEKLALGLGFYIDFETNGPSKRRCPEDLQLVTDLYLSHESESYVKLLIHEKLHKNAP